jgi:hypothetical protein
MSLAGTTEASEMTGATMKVIGGAPGTMTETIGISMTAMTVLPGDMKFTDPDNGRD